MGILEEFQCQKLGFVHSSHDDFVRSQWNIRQGTFIIWRAFWFVWHTAWMTRSIQLEVVRACGHKWFIYLTNWSYLGLVLQSGTHFAVVARYYKKRPANLSACTIRALWLGTSVCFDAALIVTVLYWTLVFEELTGPIEIVTHVFNTVYVVLDLFLVASPVRLLHFVYSVGYGAVYTLFSIIYFVAKGTTCTGEPLIYQALDWGNPKPTTKLAIGVIVAALPLVHVLQYGIYRLRVAISALVQRPIVNDDQGTDTDVPLSIV